MSDACFQLKGSAVTAMVMELLEYEPQKFRDQLEETVRQAPLLFQQAPVVISLDKFSEEGASVELSQMLSVCREQGLHPMALRSSNALYTDQVAALGLPVIPSTPAKELAERTVVETHHSEYAHQDERFVHLPNMRVTRPVRSGQQIYAKGANLVISAPVSEGAEVIADGDVYVFGALRGRAVAGVTGDTEARIYCHSLEAELVSIAGNFIPNDSLREMRWKQPAQIWLDGERLQIDPLY